MFVGIATIGAVLLTLGMPAFSPATPAYVASGLVTGITETATGVGGPPLALVYQHQPASVMRSTVAVCFLIGEVVSLVILFVAHRVEPFQLVAAVELLPFLILGSAASHAVHRRVTGRFLRAFVLLFASASGVVLVLR
jgi:uncharacterized membrane protein YfcA